MPVPPDVFFSTYAFRSSTDTTRALRSARDRIADEISVLEFGPVDTAAHCRVTMQKAFDSGQNIFFPQGYYDIDGPIILPDDDGHRTIRGAGPHDDGNPAFSPNGTLIRGNFRDYLWKTNQNYNGRSPISSISGIGFKNSYIIGTGFDTTLITQVDPPNVGTYSGNGMGCLYLQLSWLRVTNIKLQNNCGVGLYFPGINNYLSSFHAAGGFSGGFPADGGPGAQTFCCGVWGSSCTVTSGKMVGYRFGIATIQGTTFLSEFDTERCQVGLITTNPIPFWDRNFDHVDTARSATSGIVTMKAINLESFGSDSEGGCAAELVGGPIDIDGLVMTASGQIGIPDCLLLLNGAGGTLKAISGGGSVLTSGILQKSFTRAYGFEFTNCGPKVQAGKPAWDVIAKPAGSEQKDSAGSNGTHFIGCNTKGASLYNQLPLSNPVVFNNQTISDCPLPEVDYSAATPVSNHGKLVLAGSGTNLTRVVMRPIVRLAALANWIAPVGGFPGTGTNTISVTANPSNGSGGFVVQPGMIVFNDIDNIDPSNSQILGTGVYIGIVQGFVGTVLTLAINPNIGSGTGDNRAAAAGTAGDVLVFGSWTVM